MTAANPRNPQFADDADSVEQEMVRLISNQARRVPIPVFIATATLAVIAAGRLPTWMAVTWFVMAASVLTARYLALRALPERTDLTASQRLQRAVQLNLLSGLTHASALLAFPMLSESERAFFSVLLMGLCSGAVATTAGNRNGLLAYIGPVMVSMTVLWAISPGIVQPSMVERVIALLLVFYSAVLLGLAREVNRAIVEAWAIRLRERELNERLTLALESAESASRAKTRFLAAASHDLRQPLHTISTLGAALALREVDERSGQIVALLNTVTAAFAAQLDGLLDISKLDAGLVQVERKPVHMASLLRQHMVEIGELLEAKHLKPVLVCETDACADTDALLFLRVLGNLTQNAIKFTDQGSLTLEVRQAGEKIEVVVADTGHGIPLDQQDKVFQEFYQIGNQERDRAQGLGLGLSIVRRLADLLGIELQLHSTPGRGTRFVLTLPLATEHELTVQPPAEPQVDLTYSLTVLVVDDEKSVRTGLRILLEELACTCIEAAGSAQAAQLVKHRRPDLVLADFRLRGNDSGIAVITSVRERWPDVPAVLVSGDTAPDRLLEAQSAGIRLLHKPLAIDILRHELTQAKRQQDRHHAASG